MTFVPNSCWNGWILVAADALGNEVAAVEECAVYGEINDAAGGAEESGFDLADVHTGGELLLAEGENLS